MAEPNPTLAGEAIGRTPWTGRPSGPGASLENADAPPIGSKPIEEPHPKR